MKIGTTGLKQVCMVTWSLEKAEKVWSAILGMPAEHLRTPPWTEVPSFTEGKADDFCEDFILFQLENDVILEIFGPGNPNGNPWRRYLEEHGEGVMNLAFYVDEDRRLAYDAIGTVCGAKEPYHEGFYPDCTYTFVDTYPELGVQLNIKRCEDNREKIRQINAAAQEKGKV